MFAKWMTVVRIAVAVTAIGITGIFAGFGYLSNYCTDEIPDTTSIYVYTVDRGVDTLKRTYLNGKHIKPSDESRYIKYEDIPEISKLPGVETVYIFDDAAFSDFEYGFYSGEISEITVSVPRDVIAYYGDPSGMASLFSLDPEGNPEPDAECAYIRCRSRSCDWAQGDLQTDPFPFYYKYDEGTWDAFMDDLENYLIEEDAISDVSMLITLSSGTAVDSAGLQDLLMERYPGSNYMSAEFARVFRHETNGKYWAGVAVFALIAAIITVIIEIVITKAVKKAGARKRTG